MHRVGSPAAAPRSGRVRAPWWPAPWPIAAAYGSVHNEVTPEAVSDRLRGNLAGVRALHDAGVPLLAGNPLADISAIRNGKWVVANGVMYDCDPLWELADFAPAPARAR